MTRMHIQTSQRKTIDIGDGLIMRWSTKADTTNVCTLASDAFRWSPMGDPLPTDSVPPPSEWARAAVRRMLSGKSAAMSEFDFAVVEDTKREERKNPIVAFVGLHRNLAYYGSVNVHFGKPEAVATDPEYRNRGFIRRLLFEMIHPESEARGDVLQFIPGILNFYRQFGYEYGLTMPPTAKIESTDVVPPLAKEKSEPYTLRMAKLDDLPFLKSLSTPTILHTGAQVGVLYTDEYWQDTVHDCFEDRQSRFDCDRDTRIIVDAVSGKEVGCTAVSYVPFGPQLQIMALDENEATYVDVADSVLRQLFVLVKEQQALQAKERAASSAIVASSATADATTNTVSTSGSPSVKFMFNLALHEKHPLRELLGAKAQSPPRSDLGFRLYTRIKSYPIFIKAVAPELEKRLANSAMAGTTGRLRLDFFRQVEGSSGKGLEVVLEKGKIVEATEWAKPSPEGRLEERLRWKKDGITPTVFLASFAPLTFTSLLTGKHSFEELCYAYGECTAGDESTRLLLNTLFPKVDHDFDIFSW